MPYQCCQCDREEKEGRKHRSRIVIDCAVLIVCDSFNWLNRFQALAGYGGSNLEWAL